MNLSTIKSLMLKRQCLVAQAMTPAEYDPLFRMIQPVPPIYFSCPGDPPCLVHRAGFDDRAYNDGLRSRRTIVKGRFQGGTVGYVRAEDLELYMTAFRKELPEMSSRESYILDLLYREGPLTPRQIKEISGLLNKEIMPSLHKLQEAFLVYEDQTDSDWERGWYVFEREWDGINPWKYTRTEALAEILLKFLHLNVCADIEEMKSWFRRPQKEIKAALIYLEETKQISSITVEGKDGWVNVGDIDWMNKAVSVPPSVFVIHRSDFLVKSQEHILKERFRGLEVLQYILVDGAFSGAVLGHWRQGPHDVEDVVLELPREVCEERKEEILAAVSLFYQPPFSHIRKYNGCPL